MPFNIEPNPSDETRISRRIQHLIGKLIADSASDQEKVELAELQEKESQQRRPDIFAEIRSIVRSGL